VAGSFEAYADLCAVPRMSETRLANLLARFGGPEQALGARHQDLLEVPGIDEGLARAIRTFRRSDEFEQALDRCRDLGVVALVPEDDGFPTALRELSRMPPVLFARGAVEPGDRLAVAVVGMRRPSHYGRQVAENLGRDLAAHGVTVVSGLARGVDTCAHKAALAAGGRTLAVLGCGIDVCYPPENRRLYDEIAAAGAVLSEFAPGTAPLAMNFPKRNRVVAGLARAVVAVEAGDRSGVLNTAAWAADLGRDIYAVPGRVNDEHSAGTNRLLRDGARPLLSAEDVLRDIGVALHLEERAALDVSEDERPVLDLLGSDPLHVDEIGQELGLPMSVLLSVLMRLEVRGLVRQLPGKFFLKNR
jgi:DNA processing protein